jgi:hypothetical protein
MEFRYTTTNAQNCHSPNWGHLAPYNGDWSPTLSHSLPPPGSSVSISLTCSSPQGSVTRTFDVNLPPRPGISIWGDVQDLGNQAFISAPANSRLRPAASLRISWDPTVGGPVESCYGTSHIDNPLSPPTGVPSSQTFSPLWQTIRPGTAETFSLRCEGPGGYSPAASITYSIPHPDIVFTANPNLLRRGSNTTLNWSVRISNLHPSPEFPYRLDCRVRGGGVSPDHTFSVTTNNPTVGAVTTLPVMSAFVNRLTCREPLSGAESFTENFFEVVPDAEEI